LGSLRPKGKNKLVVPSVPMRPKTNYNVKEYERKEKKPFARTTNHTPNLIAVGTLNTN